MHIYVFCSVQQQPDIQSLSLLQIGLPSTSPPPLPGKMKIGHPAGVCQAESGMAHSMPVLIQEAGCKVGPCFNSIFGSRAFFSLPAHLRAKRECGAPEGEKKKTENPGA